LKKFLISPTTMPNRLCYRFVILLKIIFTSSVGFAQIDSQELVKQFDRIIQKHQVPAYAVLVTNPKRTLMFEVGGVESFASNKPATKDHWFRIGSITKTYVALAALKAVESGQLSLEKPVTAYLEGGYFTNPWSPAYPLKVVDLLEQTSGLTDMSKAEWDSNVPLVLDDALKQFADQRVIQWQPSSYFSYSNANYGLMGRVLEKATKQTFEDFISKNVFRALAIKDIAISHSDQLQAQLIPGFNTDGKTPIPYWHTIYRPLGEISLHPTAMQPMMQMLLQEGRDFLTPSSILRMETPTSSLAARAGLTYGYSLGLYDWYRGSYRFYGHGGDADGYLAHFAYQRDANLAYFVVINAFNKKALNEIRREIELAIIEPLVEKPSEAPIKLSNPRELVGRYLPVTWRFGSKPSKQSLEIFLEGRQLYARFTDRSGGEDKPYPLIPVNANTFRWRTQSDASMAIFRTDQGMLFSGDEGNFLRP